MEDAPRKGVPQSDRSGADAGNTGPLNLKSDALRNARGNYTGTLRAATPNDADLRSFTSWKLDFLDAVSTDPQMYPVDFQILFRILQRANWKTRIAFITDDRLAAEIC